MAVKSRDKADTISANREETRAGLVDTYIIKLRSYAKCHHPVVVMPFMANGSVLDYLRRERKSLVLDAEAEKSMVCICILTVWTLCGISNSSTADVLQWICI